MRVWKLIFAVSSHFSSEAIATGDFWYVLCCMKKVCFIQNSPAKPSYISRISPMYIIAIVNFFTQTYFYSLRKGKIYSKRYLSLYYLYKKVLNHLNLSRVDNVLLLVKDDFRPVLELVYTTNVYIFPDFSPILFLSEWGQGLLRRGQCQKMEANNRWCGVFRLTV